MIIFGISQESFFPLFLILVFRAMPVPCPNLQKSSFHMVGKTARVRLGVTIALDSVRYIYIMHTWQSLTSLPFLLFKAEEFFFFFSLIPLWENVH